MSPTPPRSPDQVNDLVGGGGPAVGRRGSGRRGTDTVHTDTVHTDTVHTDTVHTDTVHTDTVHTDTVDKTQRHGAASGADRSDASGGEDAHDTWREALVRERADFANYRRRTAAEMEHAAERGRDGLALELLCVLDAGDRAAAAGGGAPEVVALVRAVLEGAGLERIDTVDVEFDPERHHALEVGSDDLDMVTTIIRAGYVRNGRVLRPALVKVGR